MNRSAMLLTCLMILSTPAVFAALDPIPPGSQYRDMAEKGDKYAQYFLADTWFSAGDMKQAQRWAEKAAAAGLPDAWALLANISLQHSGKALLQAKRYAEKAALAGSDAGKVILARILLHRPAEQKACARALSLLEQAAGNMHDDAAVDAQMWLGLLYAGGICVKEDHATAAYWLKRSSALSRTGYAEYWTGMLFAQGESGIVKKDPARASYWFASSCREGFDSGCEKAPAIRP
ncbi:tetratricopeptide repeat protein [Enterobacter sp.]|uniref:tetratricopeptide repeat protein n=1 Tax=Enterobacter sp. TaxID=42895 RepID=UPI00296EA368|nr:tetratricopeptide repeat protein [Enterobacter sp.]